MFLWISIVCNVLGVLIFGAGLAVTVAAMVAGGDQWGGGADVVRTDLNATMLLVCGAGAFIVCLRKFRALKSKVND